MDFQKYLTRYFIEGKEKLLGQ